MKQRLGNYEILNEIGTGGMAAVFRGRDTRSGRIVALKVMHAHLAKDPAYVERFRREASMAMSLDHPNVVKVFDSGQADGAHYLAMEYMPGSLYDLLRERVSLSVEEALSVAAQVSAALGCSHKSGIVHRDIKPQNILIAEDGAVKVGDFGIARAMDFATMTRTGLLMGSPHYLSPEQAEGKPLDIRSDIYSLGIVLYEMLTGTVPFKADTPLVVMRMHVEREPVSVGGLRAGVPEEVETLVRKALAKSPESRFRDPAEMSEALRRCGARTVPLVSTSARRPSTPAVEPPIAVGSVGPVRRSRPPWEWLAPVAVAIALIGFFVYSQANSSGSIMARPPIASTPTSAPPTTAPPARTPTAAPASTGCQSTDALWAQVNAAWQNGDWANAIKLLDQIKSLCPSDTQVAEKSYVARYNYGLALLGAGKFTEAKEQCQNALSVNSLGAEAKKCVDDANRALWTPTSTPRPPTATSVPPTATATPYVVREYTEVAQGKVWLMRQWSDGTYSRAEWAPIPTATLNPTMARFVGVWLSEDPAFPRIEITPEGSELAVEFWNFQMKWERSKATVVDFTATVLFDGMAGRRVTMKLIDSNTFAADIRWPDFGYDNRIFRRSSR